MEVKLFERTTLKPKFLNRLDPRFAGVAKAIQINAGSFRLAVEITTPLVTRPGHVVKINIARYLLGQLRHRYETPAIQNLTTQAAEANLDLIRPRTM